MSDFDKAYEASQQRAAQFNKAREMDYQQALMAMGAEAMARLRLERDEWKAKYEELLNERNREGMAGNTPEGGKR